MNEYIEKEPLLKVAKELQKTVFGAPLIVQAIENAPTVDVIEVVKCKDCIYYIERDHSCFHPKQEYGWNSEGGECLEMELNDFCSYGERKE